jgi:F420-non-reducing hydrogenase iron-sulfur subunit
MGDDGLGGNTMMKTKIDAPVRVYYCRNSSHASEIPNAISKLERTADVFVEPVPCAGRIDPRYILKAFEGGAEAVCIIACGTGKCKMMEGNLRATRRVHAVRGLLAEAGVDPECVRIFVPGSVEEDTLAAAMASVAPGMVITGRASDSEKAPAQNRDEVLA